MLSRRNLSSNTSNIVHRSPTTAPVIGTSVDGSLLLSCPHLTNHFSRVAVVDRHDMDAWIYGWEVHDIELHAVAASSSLGSDGTVPDDYFSADMERSGLVLMELQTEGLQTMGQFAKTGRIREGTAVHLRRTSLVAPVRTRVAICPCPLDDLSEGRRRVGEILLRCGVIDISGVSPTEPTIVGCRNNCCSRLVGIPAIPSMTTEPPFGENDELLITALADWTSEWVHTLVIQPYLQKKTHFQYQGKPSRATTSVALRIRRILSNVENPVQVVIHALWSIGTLTGCGTHDNVSFLSVPIFRYLHNNGTFVVEDFMLRTFVACAMIGDKTVNDATLSTNTWSCLTRIPKIILNATEKYALSCLEWNVVMTRIQWQDAIIYLRSYIKMGSAFDPFAYDGSSSSSIMARYLDELINVSYAEEICASQQRVSTTEILAPQPIRHFTNWQVLDVAEWCPEDDPVINQKPRTIGIAPGADQSSSTLAVGTTAKDLLDTILGPNRVPDLAQLTQPTGASFRSSLGAIGTRLAHTIKIAGACQSASWFPSHG